MRENSLRWIGFFGEKYSVFGVCELVPRGAVVRLRQAAVCWAAACVCVCVVVRPLCAVCATSAGNGDGPVSSLNAANVC